MPYTHYPKLEQNVIFAWVLPHPPDKPNFLTHPRFSSLNLMKKPIGPGETIFGCHAAQNFTRFLGTVACDQPLEVTFSFSNDEVAPDGHWVTDESMPDLHYDGEALKLAYNPQKQSASGKFVVTIYGRWLRVDIKNTGDAPIESIRLYVRGSVF